jgi:hypothetical protein
MLEQLFKVLKGNLINERIYAKRLSHEVHQVKARLTSCSDKVKRHPSK